jgi:hypothetical protein
MQMLQHPSDRVGEFAIPVNYRQLFKTTALKCECPAHQSMPKSQCMHMIAAHFSELTNKQVLAKIMGWHREDSPETAIKIKLGSFEALLEQKEAAILNPCTTYIKRRRASIQAGWLLWQVEMLRKRVDLIDRMK